MEMTEKDDEEGKKNRSEADLQQVLGETWGDAGLCN